MEKGEKTRTRETDVRLMIRLTIVYTKVLWLADMEKTNSRNGSVFLFRLEGIFLYIYITGVYGGVVYMFLKQAVVGLAWLGLYYCIWMDGWRVMLIYP